MANKAQQVLIALVILLTATLAGCSSTGQPEPPLKVVDTVNLNRYLGTWYEIASIPNSFQSGCVATKATYSLRDDGRLRVENECRAGSFDGELRRVVGTAWVADSAEKAKLEVQFFWPFSGDYWIIDLDDDYRYAVVGHPARRYLWVLSRTPTMPASLYQDLLSKIATQGYDINKIKLTPQPSGAAISPPLRED